MYDFIIIFIKKTYKDQATILFTDTDSLCYHIQTNKIFHDVGANKRLFDFSDYPKNLILYGEDNKKILDKFKDDLNGELAIEFVELK